MDKFNNTIRGRVKFMKINVNLICVTYPYETVSEFKFTTNI